ncbi:MAG: hypothetical protein HC934_08825 [Acaryochloridaceae cyanobacterium SU_2_1]|nr:hypothetical protein [Acaryochloridaceae cyanobacterium SU_2_1]NJM95221.1 hypothetical protein [Acaryochloridaceae cyanobacterium CSU_5_19]
MEPSLMWQASWLYLEMYLVKLGVVHASFVLLVVEGAPWIWPRIPALLKRLGLCTEQVIELVDFYHAAENLREFSQLVIGKHKQAKAWFEKARSTLRYKSTSTTSSAIPC